MQFKQGPLWSSLSAAGEILAARCVTLTSQSHSTQLISLAARVYLDARLHFQHTGVSLYSAHGMIPNSASMSQDAARMLP
jgi:hypothetical protein